jgi:drug/metabolite transporter (DMT)-like permease
MTRPHDVRRGASLMVASAALFAGMSFTVKLASRSLPSTQVVFYRNALALLMLLPWVLRLGPGGLRTSHLREHLVRSVAGLAAMYCFFYALAHMRLGEAVLLNYSLPLFVPFFEQAWLGERTVGGIWWALGVGFLGLVLILRPGVGIFNPVALVAVVSAILAALAQVGIRRLTHTEPATRIVFYFASFSTAISVLPLLRRWQAPDRSLWGLLLAMGLQATLAQILLTRAYSYAPAAQVGPFIYSSVVFAGLIDGWFWGEWPDGIFLAGACLVCLAGILALRIKAPPEPLAAHLE